MSSLSHSALAIYLTDEIRRIEALAGENADPPLMQRAGLAAAQLARELIGDSRRSILIFAGPGNNGGDAFVVASHLMQWWHRVSVVFAGDPQRLSTDARAAFDAWIKASGEVLAAPPTPAPQLALVVDGLFGIGLQRPLDGQYGQWVDYINALNAPVLALDVPSGLHSDSGRVLGSAVRADHTMTFIALKPGLLTLDGPDHCGEIHVHDLELDVERLVAAHGHTIGSEMLARCLPRRPANSHKGTFGSAGIIGGAPGMAGAALLAARATLKLGAGRVYVGALDTAMMRVDTLQPELMLRDVDDVLGMQDLACLVLGPGLSRSDRAKECVARALQLAMPLVIDADALNLIGADTTLQDACRDRSAPTLLTPHPAEAARLAQTTTAQLQQDRIASARSLAQRYRSLVALKGAGTVIAAPDGRFHINTSGNPGLASAGMGDVLSGIVGALLAQGASAESALCTGVHLHGAAADALLENQGGPIGMTGSEVTDAARALLNDAIYSDNARTV
jgi:hydroxyethylthiazole kinase-like uncharacterized protein yjeF